MTDVSNQQFRSGTEEEIRAIAKEKAEAEAAVAIHKAKQAQLYIDLANQEAELALAITELQELPDPILIELPVMPQGLQDYRNGLTNVSPY